MERIEILDVDQAIEKLSKYRGKKVKIFTINFDKNEEDENVCTKEESCKLIQDSKSILFNDDEFIPNMSLYSILQGDINNIIPKGIVHSILFCGKLE